jgi:hypothetical protein
MFTCQHKMFYKADGSVFPIEGTYRDKSVFLIAGGPSLNKFDLTKLKSPGIMTLGINNSPSVFRPNLWVSVDDPKSFIESIWMDSRIQKFVHLGKNSHTLWDNSHWREHYIKVKDCPNMVYWKDNEWFQPDKYLTEETINWGGHTDRCECGYLREDKKQCEAKGVKRIKVCPKCNTERWGCRSVMLSAVRIAWLMGFNKIFLLGCDFKMELGKQNYAFPQERSKGSVKSNNSTYERLNDRFNRLRPIFEKNNLFVWNCYRDSGLKSFDYIDYEVALKIAAMGVPDISKERTLGLYDRKANQMNESTQ